MKLGLPDTGLFPSHFELFLSVFSAAWWYFEHYNFFKNFEGFL